MNEQPPAMFTWQDVKQVFAKYAQTGKPPPYVIGGQALNFWVEWCEQRGSPIIDAVVASKDLDFKGSSASVKVCAEILGGTAHTPSMDHATPESGKVDVLIDGGRELTIDFIPHVLPEVLSRYHLQPLPFRTEAGHPFLMMHPLTCMVNRANNVVSYAGKYDNPHGHAQLRAALAVFPAFCASRLELHGRRPVLNLYKLAFAFSQDPVSRKLWKLHAVDTLEAVVALEGLPATFSEKCLPKWRASLGRN